MLPDLKKGQLIDVRVRLSETRDQREGRLWIAGYHGTSFPLPVSSFLAVAPSVPRQGDRVRAKGWDKHEFVVVAISPERDEAWARAIHPADESFSVVFPVSKLTVCNP